jgi:hypothetical protein
LRGDGAKLSALGYVFTKNIKDQKEEEGMFMCNFAACGI